MRRLAEVRDRPAGMYGRYAGSPVHRGTRRYGDAAGVLSGAAMTGARSVSIVLRIWTGSELEKT